MIYRDNPQTNHALAAQKLLEWASESGRGHPDSLPSAVVTKALAVICDDIAAMISAGSEREVQKVGALAAARGETTAGGATVFSRTGARVNPEWAALANGVAANWLELDGGYRMAVCHGSLYTLPSALADLESRGGTLSDLVMALVSSYEVVTRVARAYRPSLPLAAHPHATLSPVGAAAAVAAARKLEPEAFANVVLSAATYSLNGPFSHAGQGATVRNAWAGVGAQLGFRAADFVEAGVSGSSTAFHDVFNTSYGYPEDVGALTDGLGESFAILDGYHKLYACCQYLHSSVEAAHQLSSIDLGDISSDDIAEITVETHAAARDLRAVDPVTVLGGKFSLPHAVATVLSTGSFEPRVFSEEYLNDPDVGSLRSKVRIAAWQSSVEPPNDRPSKITVTLRDGSTRQRTVLSAIGGPDRPLAQDQLIDKFQSMMGSSHPQFATVAEGLIGAVNPRLDVPISDFLTRLLGK